MKADSRVIMSSLNGPSLAAIRKESGFRRQAIKAISIKPNKMKQSSTEFALGFMKPWMSLQMA